jgi:hypothetical protein
MWPAATVVGSINTFPWIERGGRVRLPPFACRFFVGEISANALNCFSMLSEGGIRSMLPPCPK